MGPTPRPGGVLTRRHRLAFRPATNPTPPDQAERDLGFDRRFTVRSEVPAGLSLITTPVRSALLRAATVAPLRQLRVAGDLVIVEVDGWVLWERLDAVLDVMRAVAADVRTGTTRLS